MLELPNPMKRSHLLVKFTMIVFCSLGSVGIVIGSYFLKKAVINSQPQIVTDISRYQDIRYQLWSNQKTIQHFPSGISTDSEIVRIAYSPGVMQAGSFFQARVRKSPEQIQKLLTQYRKVAQRQYRGGDTNDHANLPNGVPTTFFYTSNSEDAAAFPNSYEILVLNAEDQGQPGFNWNNGNSYGVAIDTSASEVVYWAETW
ncbi:MULTISPECIES: hypothetical protein [unclassified Anabaena]|uniref:hypothetical protein n=1 Tax=unclassified Anabaena TaxID=2619674 RepID=UPI000B2A3163|nr:MULTISPECIES: hypothetical protein [unclassified Anabaena]